MVAPLPSLVFPHKILAMEIHIFPGAAHTVIGKEVSKKSTKAGLFYCATHSVGTEWVVLNAHVSHGSHYRDYICAFIAKLQVNVCVLCKKICMYEYFIFFYFLAFLPQKHWSKIPSMFTHL